MRTPPRLLIPLLSLLLLGAVSSGEEKFELAPRRTMTQPLLNFAPPPPITPSPPKNPNILDLTKTIEKSRFHSAHGIVGRDDDSRGIGFNPNYAKGSDAPATEKGTGFAKYALIALLVVLCIAGLAYAIPKSKRKRRRRSRPEPVQRRRSPSRFSY